MNKLLIATALLVQLFIAGAIVGVLNNNVADPDRGCEASAYQATKNGFDLEENLLACKNLQT